jgi:hypothetical protein
MSGLPEGCVYIDLPEIGRSAKALGIEHVKAMLGFRIGQGRPVPEERGIVVLKESEAILRDAHRQYMEKKEAVKEVSPVAFRVSSLGLRVSPAAADLCGAAMMCCAVRRRSATGR